MQDQNTIPSVPSPLKAARAHCLWCCNGSSSEVTLCAATGCPLHSYRLGCNPATGALLQDATAVHPAERPATRRELIADGATALRMIKRRCIDCSGGSAAEAKVCQETGCPLWSFRLGKNPNRAGHGGSFREWALRAKNLGSREQIASRGTEAGRG
jgi:hypothetical protein